MKRVISIITCLVAFVLIFTGCKTTSIVEPEVVSEKADKTVVEETTEEATEVTEEEREEVDITYMTWTYADRGPSTDALIANAKEMFNSNIELLNYPTEQYASTFKIRYAAGDLPDLVRVHRIMPSTLIAEGTELEVDTFADINDLQSVSEFNQQVIDARLFDGVRYYVPETINALGALYNKKVFSDLGLDIPTNYDEFIAVCDTIKEAGITPLGGGFKDVWPTQIIPFIAIGQYLAGDVGNDEALSGLWDGTYKWTSESVVDSFNLPHIFSEKGYFPDNFLGSDINTASANVGMGTAAMIISGNWQATAIAAANENVEVGFFALPLNDAGEPIAIPTSANEGLCLNAASENLERAKEVLNYYLSSEYQALIIADLNGIPTNTKVITESKFAQDVAKAINTADIVLPEINYFYSAYTPSEISVSIGDECQGLLAGVPTIEEYTQTRDEEIEKYLNK